MVYGRLQARHSSNPSFILVQPRAIARWNQLDRDKKLSKYLSKVLRHQPERVGIALSSDGWADVDSLISGCRANGVDINSNDLSRIVDSPDNPRYELDPSRNRVRARYGHSVDVRPDSRPVTPPRFLFHGTSRTRVQQVLRDGLQSMGRRMVHLSTTRERASAVGRRHGEPAILVIDTRAAIADGTAFFSAGGGVWLVEWVDPSYMVVEYDSVG